MPNVYDYRPGRSLKNINPQVVGEFLEQLRQEKGELTPPIILEAAAPEDSPIHAAFEWDESAAAYQHRLMQARRLVVSIRVLNSPTARPTIAYVSVRTPDKGREYRPTVEAMTDDQLKVRVLTEVRTFIESMERRYAHFAEVARLLENLRRNVS